MAKPTNTDSKAAADALKRGALTLAAAKRIKAKAERILAKGCK
jgi:hypothetical protein